MSTSNKVKYTQVTSSGDLEEIELNRPVKKKNIWWKMPPEYFNLGLYLAIPVLLGIFIGQYLDRRFQTKAFFTLILILFGTISMFYNLVKLYKNDGSAHKH